MKPACLAVICSVSTMLLLYGCAVSETAEPDRYELLSLSAIPEGKELKDECTCLNEDINALNSFAEKMHNSRYAVHYQAMSQQKISVIKQRADKIGCNYPLPQ